jgi:hypothetical protein
MSGKPVAAGMCDALYYETRKDFKQYLTKHRWNYRFAGSKNPELIREVLTYYSKNMLPPTFIQTFPWSQRPLIDNLVWCEHLMPLDPTPTENTPAFWRGLRSRKWVFGAIKEPDMWWPQDGLWPILEFSRLKGTYIPEPELFKRYSKNWGILSHRYKYPKAAWWRNRFVHAAACGAVLLADPEEVEPLGPAFLHSRDYIENLSVGELEQVAAAQADMFYRATWTLDKFSNRLAYYIGVRTGEI